MTTPVVDVQEAMARPTADTVQITFRMPTEWLARADALAKLISRPGFEASRTDAFRAAIARGFEAFESESREHEGAVANARTLHRKFKR
jgi:hypothetical protein